MSEPTGRWRPCGGPASEADLALVNGWKRELRRKGLSEKSNNKRVGTVILLARWMAPRSLLDATGPEIEDFLDERDASSQGRAWQVSNVVCFYAWCVREGHLVADPSLRLVRPRLPRRLPRPWSEETFAAAVANAKPKMRCWLLLAALAGLRCKEIAGLRREDIVEDVDPPMLVVQSGKGGHQRSVPMHPDLIAALRAYGMPPAGWLFPKRQPAGWAPKPVTDESVSKMMNYYLHRQGIAATAHQGRHRFGTSVYRESQDLRLTQELMGHASPNTTAIYAAWDSTKAAGVIGRIGLGT